MITPHKKFEKHIMSFTIRKDFHDKIVKLAIDKGISNQAQLRVMVSDFLNKK